MGYADGYYYGQGRIICDTSTFSVGDTIRVRSVYNALQTEDKQVVTVGTPLIFTVPPYDYYKICKVDEINNVETEIGGEYVTIDYGQTVRTKVVDKTSLSGIQAILNSHNESIISVGDSIMIHRIENGQIVDWEMLVGNIDLINHKIDFVSRYLSGVSQFYTTRVNTGDYANSTSIRPYLLDWVNSIVDNEKQYIKAIQRQCKQMGSSNFTTFEDKVFIPSVTELFGYQSGYNANESQLQIFITQNERIKTYGGNAQTFWTRDGYNNSLIALAPTTGTYNVGTVDYCDGSRYVLPCFTLTADS